MKTNAYKEMYENELTHPWYQVTRRLLIAYLERESNKNVNILDAGCGTGGTMKLLMDLGYKVEGLDNNELAIDLCRKRGISKVRLGNIYSLPYKDKTFDFIICLDVLYHQGVFPEKSLREFYRVLKPGGILYLEEPAYGWLASKHDIAIETRQRFTRKLLVKLVKSSNLKIVKASYFNTFLFVPIAAGRILNKLSNEKSPRSDVYPTPKILEMIISKILYLESKIFENINFPFGLSIICIAQK